MMRFARQTQRTANQQIKAYQRIARERMRMMRADQKASEGMAEGWLKAAAVISGVLFTFRRAQSLIDQQLRAAVRFGPNIARQIRGSLPPGLSETDALRFLGGIGGISDQVRFSLDAPALKALTELKGQLKNFGDIGDDLVQKYISGFGDEMSRLREFTKAIPTIGVESAIKRYATIGNIGVADQILNALATQKQVDQGTADPTIQAALKVKESMLKLNKRLEELIQSLTQKLVPIITKVADYLEKMSTGEILGTALAGYLGLKAGGAMLRGGGRLIGRGLGIGGGAAAAGGGSLLINPITGAIVVGTAAALAIDKYSDKEHTGAIGWYLRAKDSQQRVTDQNLSLRDKYAREMETAQTEIDRLKAQRSMLRAEIGAIPNKWGGGYSDENRQKLQMLQVQRQRILEKIEKLEAEQEKLTKQAEPKQKSLWETIKDGASKAADKVAEFSQKLKTAAANKRFEELKKQAARMGELQLSARLEATQTDLARQQYELARIGPFGSLGALPEMRSLNATIESEMSSLQEVLSNIDTNTKQGQIEANGIRGQILRLRTEEKRNNSQVLNAMLDNTISQAFGAGGRFSKILITDKQNLAPALEKGIATPDLPYITGTVGTPSGRQPLRTQDFLRTPNPLLAIEKHFRPPAMPKANVSPLPTKPSVTAPTNVRPEVVKPEPQKSEPRRPRTTTVVKNPGADGLDELEQAGRMIVSGVNRIKREREGDITTGVTPLVMQSVMSGQP